MALLNNGNYLITSESLVRVDDPRQHHKQQKVCIHAEVDELMLMLKCYTNLVCVVFSDTCPLFKVLREVIIELRDFQVRLVNA